MTHLVACSLGVTAILLGCGRPASTPNEKMSSAQHVGCSVGTRWERNSTVSNAPQAVDLDCDGTPDTIKVELFDSAGVGYWRMSARYRGAPVSLTSPWEDRPELVGAVDLDADGTLEILFAAADESGIAPWLVDIGGGHPRTLPIAGPPHSYQYRFSDTPSNACVEAAMPHVAVDSLGRGGVRLSVNSGEPRGACPAALVRVFHLESDSLRADSQ